MEDVKNSLSENWSHQRLMNDQVILLKEKVAQLENSKKMQSNFIAGIVTSFILAIFYFGSQSAVIMDNSKEISNNRETIDWAKREFGNTATWVEQNFVSRDLFETHTKDH